MPFVRIQCPRLRLAIRLLLVAVCLLAAFGHRTEAASRASAPSRQATALPSATFAIADFDGDRLPDLAVVEVVGAAGRVTSYSIRLKFGAGSESRIGIAARAGGLRIYPRDINGDNQVDLVVRAETGPQLVAVLLNDGHGNFRSADLKSFQWIQEERPLDSLESIPARLLFPELATPTKRTAHAFFEAPETSVRFAGAAFRNYLAVAASEARHPRTSDGRAPPAQ